MNARKYDDETDQPCCKCCTSMKLKWTGVALTLLGVLTIAVAMFVPNIIRKQVHDGVLDYIILSENGRDSKSDSYMAWADWTSDQAEPVDYKVHIFNLTNPEDVVAGGVPVVVEVGPYIFREVKKRFNVTFQMQSDGHETCTFREWVYYVFDPIRSAPLSLSDMFISPDLVFQGLVAAAFALTPGSDERRALESVIAGAYGLVHLKDDQSSIMFKKMNATAVVFGYQDNILALLGQDPNYAGLVGNYSTIPVNQPWDMIYTGSHGESYLARSYLQWKNQSYLIAVPSLLESNVTVPLWSTPSANRIRGTDATTVAPTLQRLHASDMDVTATFQDAREGDDVSVNGGEMQGGERQRQRVEVWVSDVNRTATMVHVEDVKYKDIPLQRFRLDRALLLNATKNPENKPFDMDGPSGILNLTKSNSGVPIFVSKPHFLDADDSLSSAVVGLSPSADLHDTFVDIEPMSGITMRGAKRLQINVDLHPIVLNPWLVNVSWFPKMKDHLILPLVWLEESSSISDSSASSFSSVLTLLSFASISMFVFYIFGNLVIGLGVILFFASVQRKQAECTNDVNIQSSSSSSSLSFHDHDRYFNEPLFPQNYND